MLGAIIGDMSGSRFEWDNIKTKNFELLNEECFPTDDSIMTVAIAKTILECNGDYAAIEEKAIKNMQMLGRLYPMAGYGARFYDWLFEDNPKPYHSFGNGAAMRVSPCGFAAGTMEEAIALAKAVTKVTHNHREGMKAAEAVTVAIFMARSGKKLAEIREHIEKTYYKMLSMLSLDEMYELYDFLAEKGIGGDSDTIAAITGSMAEAYYGIPSAILERALALLDDNLLIIAEKFEKKFGQKKEI